MSENPTREEVLASIVPKSDQLNADDLVAGPLTVRITSVTKGDREQPIVVGLEGYRPYKPCKTMRRILIAVFGDDPKQWVGQRLTLYCDPDVLWAGVKVGGIRISHMSGIANPRTFLLTIGRGKRIETTMHPLADVTEEEERYIAEATRELQQADSLETLAGYAEMLKGKSAAIRAALKAPYAKRLAELKHVG